VLSLLVGIRTEEARALRWDHVVTWADDPAGWQPVASGEFDPTRAGEGRFAIYVWRSEREGGDTRTEKSRRTLALPRRCVEALRPQRDQQERDRLMVGELWQEHGLVFASRVGTPLSANNVIRAFRLITRKAGLRGLDAPGAQAHLRVGHVRQRRARREHRPARRSRPHGHHRVGLPPRDPARAHPRRGGDGQDLRLTDDESPDANGGNRRNTAIIGGPWESDGSFAIGFFDIADTAVERWKAGHRNDAVVIPIIYNYRHGIELALKDEIREAAACLREDGATDRRVQAVEVDKWVSATHSIEQLVNRLTRLLGRLPLGPDQQLPAETLEVLKKLHVLDHHGEAFRYSAMMTGSGNARVLERI
jgi:hypothetical protein